METSLHPNFRHAHAGRDPLPNGFIGDLSAHLTLCNRQRGAWFGWQCQADAAHSFFASRIVTCVLVAALVAYLMVQLLG